MSESVIVMNVPKKKGKKWPIIFIIILILAAAVAAAVFFFGKSKKIDISDYVKVKEVVGFNGTGEIKLEFDYVSLTKDLEIEETEVIKELEKIQEENGLSTEYIMDNEVALKEDYGLELKKLKGILETVSIEVYNNGNFSNGDTALIKVEIEEEKEFSDRLKSGKFEYKIKDLRELVEVSFNVNCDFDGANGSGVANCTITDEYEDWHSYVYFSCNENGRLSNGDIARIEATIQTEEYESLKEKFDSQGLYLPESFQWEFTVSGLTERLTPETCTDEIIDQAEQIVQDEVKLADPTLQSRVSMVYFVKDGSEDHIVVALEFPDPEANRTWNHIRYLSDVAVTEEGELKYSSIEHVLGGNGFDEKAQQDFIENFEEFYNRELTKLR